MGSNHIRKYTQMERAFNQSEKDSLIRIVESPHLPFLRHAVPATDGEKIRRMPARVNPTSLSCGWSIGFPRLRKKKRLRKGREKSGAKRSLSFTTAGRRDEAAICDVIAIFHGATRRAMEIERELSEKRREENERKWQKETQNPSESLKYSFARSIDGTVRN